MKAIIVIFFLFTIVMANILFAESGIAKNNFVSYRISKNLFDDNEGNNSYWNNIYSNKFSYVPDFNFSYTRVLNNHIMMELEVPFSNEENTNTDYNSLYPPGQNISIHQKASRKEDIKMWAPRLMLLLTERYDQLKLSPYLGAGFGLFYESKRYSVDEYYITNTFNYENPDENTEETVLNKSLNGTRKNQGYQIPLRFGCDFHLTERFSIGLSYDYITSIIQAENSSNNVKTKTNLVKSSNILSMRINLNF